MLDFDLDGCGWYGTDGLHSEVNVFRYLYQGTSDRDLCYCVILIYRYYWPTRREQSVSHLWRNDVTQSRKQDRGVASRAHVPVDVYFQSPLAYGKTGLGYVRRQDNLAGLRFSRMLPFHVKWLIMASGNCFVTSCTYYMYLTMLWVANLRTKSHHLSPIPKS